MAVFILSTREPVPEFSITLKWGIELIRNWMKWKVLDQKIYCKVLTWIKPADGGSSCAWLTRTEGICVGRKCSRRVAPNGQIFPGNCSVPPFLHCHHSWHSPVLHQTNQKVPSFLSQVGYFFNLLSHIVPAHLKSKQPLFSLPLMYQGLLLHWNLNCVSQHSLLLLTLVTPTVRYPWERHKIPQEISS